MAHFSTLRLVAAATSLMLPVMAQAQNGILQRDTTKAGAVTFLKVATSGPNQRAANTILPTLRTLLKLREQDELRPLSTQNDGLGFTHIRHAQYYKGVPVEYGTYVVHTRNGAIETMNGQVIKVGELKETPTLSEKDALAKALASIGATQYRWQVLAQEQALVSSKNDPTATYYPKGTLIVSQDETVTTGARLAYKFAVYAQQPTSATYVYVDAHSGQVFRKTPINQDVNISATAATRYSGSQAITTDQTSSSSYRLRETDRGSGASMGNGSANINTYNANGILPPGNMQDITNNTTSWSGDVALDAHWAAEKTYDYFRNTFGWNSYNNNGAALDIYTHCGNVDQAYWDTNNHLIALFDGNHANPYTALDVVSHEIAHGYTQFLVNLDVSLSEPAAINEGLSDIWGACVEFYAAPTKQCWRTGEEISKNNTCTRNFATPNSGFDPFYAPNGYPDTYQGARYTANGDPHVNSTILSHCFYLLAVGATATNSEGTPYSVTGIGINKAANILFRAESMGYITSTTSFSGVRQAMITAANDLYGCSSPELQSTENAWFAVGVGSAAPQLSLSGPTQICSSGVAYTAATSGPVTWSSSDPSIATINASTGVANAVGTGTVTFTAISGCVSGKKTVQVYNGQPIPTGTWYYYTGSTSTTPLWTVQYVSPGQITLVLDPLNNFSFSSNNPAVPVTIVSSRSASFTLGPNMTVQIKAMPTNSSCIRSGTYVFSSQGYHFAITPNPASSDLTVTQQDQGLSTLNTTALETTNALGQVASHPFEADLYDMLGTRIATTQSTAGRAVFKVHNLPAGPYVVRITQDKTIHIEHVQISH